MEALLVRPENEEQLKAIKAVLKVLHIDFVSKKGTEYNPDFVKKIQNSRKQAKEGKETTVNAEDLWK